MGRSAWAVWFEKLLARRFPKPDVETTVRALPRPRAAGRPEPVSEKLPLLSPASLANTRQAPARGEVPGACPAPADLGEAAVSEAGPGATPRPEASQPAPGGESNVSTAPVPAPAPVSAPAAQRRRDELTPLSERRYKIQLTAGQSLHDSAPLFHPGASRRDARTGAPVSPAAVG